MVEECPLGLRPCRHGDRPYELLPCSPLPPVSVLLPDPENSFLLLCSSGSCLSLFCAFLDFPPHLSCCLRVVTLKLFTSQSPEAVVSASSGIFQIGLQTRISWLLLAVGLGSCIGSWLGVSSLLLKSLGLDMSNARDSPYCLWQVTQSLWA